MLSRTDSQRIIELDGLRGIGILMVVIYHYFVVHLAGRTSIIEYIASAFFLTWTGVDLFFVLSGFLIGSILMDHKESPNYFRTFYIRRICRIFPLYYTWILILGGLTLFFPYLKHQTPLSYI